jgi:sodium/bile acid cotransporter 7
MSLTETIEPISHHQKQQEHAHSSTVTNSGTAASSKIDLSSITTTNVTHDKSPSQHSRLEKFKSKAYALFLRYWFLLGLAIVIGLAWAFPQVGKAHGDIEAQYTVKWGAVIVIFLLSGLGLEVSVMLKTILRWRLHLIVQVINFILLPFVMYGVVRFFIAVHANLDMTVYKGWMIALSTSTTVSSNAIMTRNANGNDGAGLLKNMVRFIAV